MTFIELFEKKKETFLEVQAFIDKMMQKYKNKDWSDRDESEFENLVKQYHGKVKGDLLDFLNDMGYVTTSVDF